MIIIVRKTNHEFISYDYSDLLNDIKNDLLESQTYLDKTIYLAREDNTFGYNPVIRYYHSHQPSSTLSDSLEQATVKCFIEEMEQYTA